MIQLYRFSVFCEKIKEKICKYLTNFNIQFLESAKEHFVQLFCYDFSLNRGVNGSLSVSFHVIFVMSG